MVRGERGLVAFVLWRAVHVLVIYGSIHLAASCMAYQHGHLFFWGMHRSSAIITCVTVGTYSVLACSVLAQDT